MGRVLLVIFVLMSLVSACAHVDTKKLLPHYEPWTKKQKVMLGISVGAAGADYWSSKEMLHRGNHENNPIVGKHPDDATLLGRGILGYLAILAVANWYPELREMLLASQSAVCIGFTIHNSRLKRVHPRVSKPVEDKPKDGIVQPIGERRKLWEP